MRIVGGKFRGRPLVAPKGLGTRPTTDRTRESLFNILTHRDDINLEGARVIDLFAGSGALGLEAMSRGAIYCLFVEGAAKARAVIRDNLEEFELLGTARIHRRSATALGEMRASTGGPFDLAFLDAPYEKELTEPALISLRAGCWLAPDAVCIVEQSAKEDLILPDKFIEQDRRVFGDTQIIILRYQGVES